MVNELRLFRFVDGVNDTPFPNKEANDEQIVITSFTYNAQRMAATPTITASINYPRCLDNDWDVNVYATFNNEKYYIRQIPSSSKDNTNVMYKHDLTLYSERFVLENIYFTDIEKKTENGVDVFVKRETTSIIYRFNLIDYVERLNWSLEASDLPYRVVIDDSIINSEKAKETKDISLEHAYLASAIQEIYNQWEIPFYFEGTNVIVKDCSENINDVVLEYGAENSLLSIKKNNANFRKITRVSGYGGDKNIPFYYPNWSQKGIIDAMPLSTNSKLTKSMLTITDMKKFDKKMPLNGNVKYKGLNEKDTLPTIQNNEIEYELKYKNQTSTGASFNIPFKPIREEAQFIEVYFDAEINEVLYPAGVKNPQNTYIFEYLYEANVLGDKMHSPLTFENSYWSSSQNNENTKVLGASVDRQPCHSVTIENSSIESKTIGYDGNIFRYINVKRTMRVCLVLSNVTKGDCFLNIHALFSTSDTIKKQEVIGYYTNGTGGIFDKTRDYIASINENENYINIKLSNFSIQYPTSSGNDNGWYLNETKKINLSDIGISINGTPDDSWSGEGFTQEIISKIPTAQNLMPSIYRNSIGERKFYNAINYPRPLYSRPADTESGEYQNGFNVENSNYEDAESNYYLFETLWTQNNQNEHIQEFNEIYPSITNVTNANNEPIDEILDVWFDDNDNNEVDEEGKYIHPYFYIRIPQFNGNNGFNLFDHKIVGGEMQVAMTSGDCAACNFKIMVNTRPSKDNETYEDVINPIKTKIYMGKRVPVDGDSNKITAGNFGSEDTTQQDSRNGSIWLVLEKDNQTFNETYPNYAKGVYPKVGDKFVLLNIDMPRSYVLEAEEKLTKEVIKYMSENNSDKWNFDIDFSRIFLQENQDFYGRLDENCKLYVKYNGLVYNFYVNNYKYEVKANEALPKITVGLVDTITVNRGITQNIVDGVMEAIHQTYDIEEGLDYDALYFRKSVPETITHKTTFDADVDINGNLNVGEIKLKKLQSPMYGGDEVMGSGFQLEEDENGNSTLTVDNVNVRKKLKATEFVIQQIQFQGGIVIQSAAAMECNRVETLSNGNFKCYFDTKEGSVSNQFMLNDLARCQRVGYAPKYYWRKVIEVGSDYIVLSNVTGEYEQNSDTPSEGDIIVQMGNTTNTDRQSAIEMNTVGENSPSFIMYSGINSFSLVGKDITGIVYHQKVFDANGNVSIEAYPELYSYGSMYFGDREKKENFIQFAPNENGTFEMLINAKTSFNGGTSDLGTALDALLSGVQNAQGDIANVVSNISNLQAQIDGEVNSWFMEGKPTLGNEPAKNWTTETEKQRHEGDTYTDITEYVDDTTTPTAGQSWRWCNCSYTTDDGMDVYGWHWHKIADSDAVKALAEAGKAQKTAGWKSTTFIVQPTNYSDGDLWILQSDTDHTAGKKGDILTANTASVTYDANHWSKEVKYTDDTAVNNMQIGGVNLVAFNDIMLWNGTQERKRPTITITANSSYQGGIYLLDDNVKVNTDYVLSFKLKKTSGDILLLGGYLGTATIEMYVDGVLKTGTFGNGISFPNDTNEHSVVIKFKQSAAAGEGKLFIQPNRANWKYAFTCVFSDIQLEQGTKATTYKPNEADRIEARENLLKDVMVFDRPIASNNTTYTRIYTTEALKPNTEYVFSIESIVLKSGSATPTDISIMFWASGASNAPINIPYSDKKMSAVVTTPSYVNENTQFFLYAGKHQATQGVGYMAFGVKLAEGNVYTGWEATPSEQQALIAVSKAMDGTTDIIGGLMLTNLIGMKNSQGAIKAGVSGLTENNNLRFWAGSSSWENANIAPFRVYENGEVYAGNFFGFNGAFEINSSNFHQVCSYELSGGYIWATINYRLTGGNIYLGDLSAIKTELGSNMVCFTFPTIAEYVGARIQIYNPFNYSLGGVQDIAPFEICNTSNYYSTISSSTTLTDYKKITDGIYKSRTSQSTTSGIVYTYQYYRWSVILQYGFHMYPSYCTMVAVPVKVPSGKTVPTQLRDYLIHGSLTSAGVTSGECIFMRWIFEDYNDYIEL